MQLFRGLIGGALIAALVFLCGCGGSSSDLRAGQVTIVLKASTDTTITTPISAIEVTLVLPQGISVATTGSTSEQIVPDALVPGAGLNGTNLASGRYSASSRTTHLSMVTTGESYRGGEFLRLICNVAPHSGVTPDSVRTLPVTVTKAVGYDPIRRSTVMLPNSIKVTLDLL